MDGDAKDVFPEQFEMVEVDFNRGYPEASGKGYWTHINQDFSMRVITNEVLRFAYDLMAREKQSDKEDEGQLDDRIPKAVRPCLRMFSQKNMVNFYVHGLRTAVGEMVAHKVSQLTVIYQLNLSAI